MFVRNDCTRDVRVLREAKSLAAAGDEVTVIGLMTGRPGSLAEREDRDGFAIIRIAAPSDWLVRWRTIRFRPWRAAGWAFGLIRRELAEGPRRWPVAAAIALGILLAVPFVAVRAGQRVVARRRLTSGNSEDVIDWLVRWRWSVLGWAERAADAAPSADVYHGHDLNAMAAAVFARDRAGGRLVYDSHELFLEAGSVARRPGWARRLLRLQEGQWARAADAVITVNDSIARALTTRYRTRRTVVVRNCPPRWSPPASRPRLLHEAAGIPRDRPLVLYHGGFLPDRGLTELAMTILEPGLEQVHLVYMGFGPEEQHLRNLAADGRFGDRLHILPAVDPGELLAWVASADVAAMPNLPVTLNERYSTPNKLFESIAAGTPVVSSDMPERRAIVLGDPDGPLGELCDPTHPSSIAAAIQRILELPADAAANLRDRCLRAGAARLNWERESETLLALFQELERMGPRPPRAVG